MQAEHGSVAEMPCMSFWCMFAGVVMQRLQAAGVRSILLTSGTLSPLPATAEELCVPMPVRLENPHVVKPSQVCFTAAFMTDPDFMLLLIDKTASVLTLRQSCLSSLLLYTVN